MRMWLLPPSCHCRKHLLGAHVECHMLAGALAKGKNLGRLLSDGFVDPSKVQEYHDALVEEMLRRGYKHRSPLVCDSEIRGEIDVKKNALDLRARCSECKPQGEI